MKWLLILFCFVVLDTLGNSKIDSLKTELNLAKEDTLKATLLLQTAKEYKDQNFDSLIKYANVCLRTSEKIGYTAGIINSKITLANAYQIHKETDNALKCYFEALQVQTDGFKRERTSIHHSVGRLLEGLNRLDEARKHYKKAYFLAQEIEFSLAEAITLEAIGNTFSTTEKKDSNLLYLNRALEVYLSIKDTIGTSRAYYNMGITYRDNLEYEIALTYFQKSLRIAQSNKNLMNIANCNITIGSLNHKLFNYKVSKSYYKNAVKIGRLLNDERIEISAMKGVAANLYKLGQSDSAYALFVKAVNRQDSLTQQNNLESINEMATKYETEKKQLEIEKLKKDEEAKAAKLLVQDEELKRQNLQKIAFAGGFLLMLVLAFVVFRSYRQKRKDNLLITAQKENAEAQKKLVEEKNKEITDSITYAKRIQEAILPPVTTIKQHLPNSFVFYQPKDIVAGDFYWMEKMGDTIYLAAADCTGHGVPGAMVSVVCSTALSKALLEEKQTDVGKLLDKTREIVVNQLAKGGEDIKDGMDISLCSLTPLSSGEGQGVRLQWAGANNPLWIVNSKRNNWPKEAIPFGESRNFGMGGLPAGQAGAEIKPNKQPIGKYDAQEPFTSHSIELEEGDTIFLFSDGFQDQFGGKKGKKYKVAPLKQFVLSIQDKDMETQHKLIKEEFDNWKGDIEQVDDVCIIGVRI